MTSSRQVPIQEIYRFLAQAMRYPEAGWFADFLPRFAALLADLNWPTKDEFVSGLSDQYLEDLQVEYTRLFITGVPVTVASPYASVHLDDMMNGPAALRTKQFYLEHGYELADGDFPDHIVTELDFAAILEEEESGNSNDFLDELFCPWFSLFKEKVLQGTGVHYYRTTVELIELFVCPATAGQSPHA